MFLDIRSQHTRINIDDIANKLQIKSKISFAYPSTKNSFSMVYRAAAPEIISMSSPVITACLVLL